MDRSTRGYQRVGVLILAALAWLMPGIACAAVGATDKLQVLVNDTAAQLQLAYRQHPDERARRQEQLSTAIEAWRAGTRTEANNERLANWLRAAILSSMPGSCEPLPAVPSFAVVVKAEPRAESHEPTIEPKSAEIEISKISKKVPVKSAAKTQTDPFRDDPISDGK